MRLRVIYSGRVQGVGFRATAATVARRHRVTGWVRNQPDGTVLLEVQGEPGEIEATLDELRLAMSRNIKHEERTPLGEEPGEAGFNIR